MLRYAHALPSEQRVQEMTDGDYERAAQTLREAMHCTVCGAPLQEATAGTNAGFDMARFARMKEGKTL